MCEPSRARACESLRTQADPFSNPTSPIQKVLIVVAGDYVANMKGSKVHLPLFISLLLVGRFFEKGEAFCPQERKSARLTTVANRKASPNAQLAFRPVPGSSSPISRLTHEEEAMSHRAMSSTAIGAGALNLGLENYKLQSMATYSTITALIMNACLRLYTSQKFQRNASTGKPKRRERLFSALTAICIVSGTFTAVLFNILGIYSKECLGMGNQAGYLAFQAATAMHRKWGFRCFLTTCLGFLGSFFLSIFENTRQEDRIGNLVFVASVLLTLLGAYHIHYILQLATNLIYTPAFREINNIA